MFLQLENCLNLGLKAKKVNNVKEEKKTLYFKLVPKFIRHNLEKNRIKKTILSYYAELPEGDVSQAERIALNYLQNNKLCVFPYPFQHDYKRSAIKVYSDKARGLRYVLCDGKRLYFKRNTSTRGIKRAYNYLAMEQDKQSPHRYLTDTFTIGKNDILVDVGAAEGNLPLSVIEKVKRVYLFETDDKWIEALTATFAPWKEKVVIINKFVSDKNDEKNVSLDEFFKNKEAFTFLKIDAEGAEAEILDGGQTCLSSIPGLKVAVCTYHKPDDATILKGYLDQRQFNISYSDGYMIFTEPKTFFPPYLRKGLIRATK